MGRLAANRHATAEYDIYCCRVNSMEVSPHLAYDTESTEAEARRLWKAFDRPNGMIKIPATREGLPAIQALTREGINVNATLIFSRERMRDVWEQFVSGLEIRQGCNESVDHIASVASFFVSRIDTKVDAWLANDPGLSGIQGEAAIALARLCHADQQCWLTGDRWQRLAAAGAHHQRQLWASMSVKNPAYSDINYVEALIGPGTVSTLPLDTLAAYRDHGQPALRLNQGLDRAAATVETLEAHGLHLEAVANQLEQEGVQKFVDAYDRLLNAIEQQLAPPKR